MPLVNHAKKEINAKIVYVGPESAGKSTNLNHIFSKLKKEFRGAFKSMNLQNDRMLFFDFIPSGQATLNGYAIRFHIYTLTGEVANLSSWKMVLKGVDGLVFVADSDPARMEANVESLRLITSCLDAYGKSLSDIPCIIQCNKRDLPGAVSPEELKRTLNPGGLAMISAAARAGEGVLESIFNLVKMVMKNIRAAGIDVDRQAEQLHRAAVPPAPALHEEPSFEAGRGEAPISSAGEEAGIGREEPLPEEAEPAVEFVGEPEMLAGGRLRLPLSVRCNGRERKFALDISLVQDSD